MDKITKIQELQRLLYGLFNERLFSAKGSTMQEGDNTPPEIFLPKSLIIDLSISILNSFGEELSKDDFFKEESK